MRSSRHLTRAFFAAVLTLTPVIATAQADQYAKGVTAANKGDALGAKDAFCAIADKTYKPSADQQDAGTQCVTFTSEAAKALNRSKLNYVEGVQLMNDGKFD